MKEAPKQLDEYMSALLESLQELHSMCDQILRAPSADASLNDLQKAGILIMRGSYKDMLELVKDNSDPRKEAKNVDALPAQLRATRTVLKKVAKDLGIILV